MDYLSKLNEKQYEAATCTEGPLLILAGAGSGKTSTMVHRMAYLIKEKQVAPQNILAVTFTNKAAAEMRERLSALLGREIFMWILTFHSACLRILRENAELIGYDRDFVIYDTTDQKTVIKTCLKEQNVDSKKYTPAYVLSVISDCKEKNMGPEAYREAHRADPRVSLLYPLYRAYEDTLKKNNAMDFDDLIVKTVHLFEQEEAVLLHYQEKFRYIMVDEYQDTNHMQYRFVKLLAENHNNICVVGDDDQCIYQWRGADIQNILDFEKDFRGTKVIKLEQNYRSSGNILEAAHSVISRNAQRRDKKLWTDRDAGDKVRYYRADNDMEEARFIAAAIDRMKTGERKYSDFAVLYRANSQSRRFEDAFAFYDIPYRVLSGFRYYDRKEIKDMLCYMRLVLNPADDLSFERIINEPKRGIGEKTLQKLRVLAAQGNMSLLEALKDPAVRAGLSARAAAEVGSIVETLIMMHEEKDNLKVSDLYDNLLVRTGYLAALESQKTLEAESRIENLMEFKSVISDAEKENGELTLSEFMEKMALVSDVDNHDPNEDAVVLMTLHSAKGLEFPVVFMPGMEDGLFPSWRSFEKPGGLEEERRLCYVGMTRAKEKLCLTSAEERTLYGKTDYTKESVFMREVNSAYLEGDAVYRRKSPAESRDRYNGHSAYNGSYSESVSHSGSGYDPSGLFGEEERGAIFRPFDQLARVKANSAAGAQSLELAAGDKVSHNKFGAGLVIEATDKIVTVAFDSVGIKKLARDIAPLKKL